MAPCGGSTAAPRSGAGRLAVGVCVEQNHFFIAFLSFLGKVCCIVLTGAVPIYGGNSGIIPSPCFSLQKTVGVPSWEETRPIPSRTRKRRVFQISRKKRELPKSKRGRSAHSREKERKQSRYQRVRCLETPSLSKAREREG